MLYFLHIPKSAGTSVRQLFSSVYQNNLIEVYRDVDESYRKALVAQCNNQSVLFGHFCFSLHELLGDKQPRYITLLRHPVDRVISWYKHQLRDANSPLFKRVTEDRLSLGEIIELGLAQEVNNHSVRMLCVSYKKRLLYSLRDRYSAKYLNKQNAQFNAQRHLRGAIEHIERYFSFVGTIEHTSTLRDFLIAQNRSDPEELPPIPRVNVAPPIDVTPDSQTLLLIHKANQLDLALYERYASKPWPR